MLDLMDEYQVDKFYLSHLNYSGRGKRSAENDAFFNMTKQAMTLLFERAWQHINEGRESDFVTGNNDADGAFLLQWAQQKFADKFPKRVAKLKQSLINWGGNASGVNVANIDNTGTIHPDTYWWDHAIGNVKTDKFSDIWQNTQDPLMLGFRQKPRPVKGRCRQCQYLAICGGNTRTRAFAQTGDVWSEDPGCYLSDQEIGLKNQQNKAIDIVELT